MTDTHTYKGLLCFFFCLLAGFTYQPVWAEDIPAVVSPPEAEEGGFIKPASNSTPPAGTPTDPAVSLPVITAPTFQTEANPPDIQEKQTVADSVMLLPPVFSMIGSAMLRDSTLLENLPAKPITDNIPEIPQHAINMPSNTPLLPETVDEKKLLPSPPIPMPQPMTKAVAAPPAPKPVTLSISPVKNSVPAEEDTVKIIMPTPKGVPTPNLPTRNQPLSVYDRNKTDEASNSFSLQTGNIKPHTPKEVFDPYADLISSITNLEEEEMEREANIFIDFSSVPVESEAQRIERLQAERKVQRAKEIKAVQARAHLNYKTQTLPDSIYSTSYSAENSHLPKPQFANQYTKLAFQAINAGDLPALRTFLVQANVTEQRDRAGNTPLLYATEKGKLDIVQLLLARHADINAINNRNASALHIATYTGQLAITNILLDAGARVNGQDNQGYTPLMLATMAGRDDLVKLLLAYNASTRLRDNGGRTAQQIATDSGNSKIADLLLAPTPAATPVNYYNKITSKEITPAKKKISKKKVTKKKATKKSSKKKTTKKPAAKSAKALSTS
jgi:uncharacterized protein